MGGCIWARGKGSPTRCLPTKKLTKSMHVADRILCQVDEISRVQVPATPCLDLSFVTLAKISEESSCTFPWQERNWVWTRNPTMRLNYEKDLLGILLVIVSRLGFGGS